MMPHIYEHVFEQFRIVVHYVGESFGDAANTILIPEYALFDATVSFDFE
jgi:hypothetical protein